MFRKLVSNVSFSPALVGQLGFYARRLKQEESTRRIGLIFTALALVIQSFVVFTPPEPANAASHNDMVYGGIESRNDALAAYDRDKKFRDVMALAGVTRSEIANTTTKTLSNTSRGKGSEAWLGYGYHSRYSAAQGETKHVINGTTVFSRPHYLYGDGLKIKVLYGYSKKLGDYFAIQYSCGNLWTPGLPTPPPPPPPPPPAPKAECSLLTAVRVSDNSYRLRAKAAVANSASISRYSFSVSDQSGKTVKSLQVSSAQNDITTEPFTLSPGNYKANVIVKTSLGETTSKNCSTSFSVPVPGVSVTKKVNNKEYDAVTVNQEFSYGITVKNTGQTTLKSIVVTDNAPTGINFTSASHGNVTAGKWTYTISSLAPGKSQTFSLKAKAPKTVSATRTTAKNTVCVSTASIPGEPDDCDDAVVSLPENQIRVCDLSTNQMITVKESAFSDQRHSKNPDACVRIQVCDLATSTNITIRKTDFNDQKQSRSLSDCEKVQVCDLQSGDVTTIARHQFDSQRHSNDAADCVPTVSQQKKATNLTQGGKDATTTVARASDRIQYTLTAMNHGKVEVEAEFVEQVDDVLEYAAVSDAGGGEYDTEAKTIVWPAVMLAPGESQSRIFTVQVDSAIPAGARGVSDASSYDCVMTNTFGNSTDVRVDCPVIKGVESVVKELPATGTGGNLLFAGMLLAVVTYFYARARQLKTEVRLIRRDLNSGALHQA